LPSKPTFNRALDFAGIGPINGHRGCFITLRDRNASPTKLSDV
jgi:hypothetical protein